MKIKKESNKKLSLVTPDSRVSIMSFAMGAFFIAILTFAYYAITWRNFFNFQLAIDTCAKPFCDFSTFYYPMGEVIFHTGIPLEGFVYSPFIAILMAVFPPFGFNTSLVLWGILQASVVILYLFLFRRLVPAKLPVQLLFVALTLLSFPLLHNLTWGQVGIITTVLILGALFFYERGQRIAAANLLVIGISFKFFPFIFFVPFIIRRNIRFLLIGAATCVIFLFVVPAILLGVDGMLHFYSALFGTYQNFDWITSNYNSQYFPHVMLRLGKTIGYSIPDYLPFLRGVAYLIAALNIGLIFLVQRAGLRYANLWSFHLLFLTIPFVLNTSWPVDLVYTPFAQALLAWQLTDGERTILETSVTKDGSHQSNWFRRLSPRRVGAFFFLLTSVIISNIVFFNLYHDSQSYGLHGFIFWASLFLLMASYMEFLPLVSQQFYINPNWRRING